MFFIRCITIGYDLVGPDSLCLNRWLAGFNLGDFPLLMKLVRTSSAIFGKPLKPKPFKKPSKITSGTHVWRSFKSMSRTESKGDY